MTDFPLRHVAPLGSTVILTPHWGAESYEGLVIDALDEHFESYTDPTYIGPARYAVLAVDIKEPELRTTVRIADMESFSVTFMPASTEAPGTGDAFYSLDRDTLRTGGAELAEQRPWVRVYSPDGAVRAAGQLTEVNQQGELTVQLRLEPVLDEGSDDARHAAHDALPLTLDVGGADVVRVYPGNLS